MAIALRLPPRLRSASAPWPAARAGSVIASLEAPTLLKRTPKSRHT